MKDKKDKNNIDEKLKNKFSLKRFILYVLLLIVSLVGVFFLSTYIRWNAEISNKNEILYYGQEEVKISELKDFYGINIDFNLDANEALLIYCSNIYGGECVTGDFSDELENLFRKPNNVINMVILFDLLILFIILKDKKNSRIKILVISILIILYGFYSVGVELYRFFDYYKLVNNSEYLVNAVVYKGLKTENRHSFKPVVSYTIDKDSYILYLDYDMEGNISDNINNELTLYYAKKDKLKVSPQRKLTNYILPVILGGLTTILGFIYLLINKKNKER